MAKGKQQTSGRTKRVRLSEKEILKRMEGFSKRKERLIASVRKDKNRSVSA